MNREFLDLYSNYLTSSFRLTTATGLSELTDGVISHDKVTRFLNSEDFTSAKLWKLIKSTVREIESKDGVLIVDDTIEEKPSTDENDIVCWHFDHCTGKTVKGVNIISLLYYSQDVSLPVGFTIVDKTILLTDPKTGKQKRVSSKNKNEHFRDLLLTAKRNNMQYKYVLADVWYASEETMKFIVKDLKKDFIMPLKHNRKVALSLDDKKKGKYVKADELKVKSDAMLRVYLEGVPFPVLLIKHIYKNADGSNGIIYLMSSDLTLTGRIMVTIYHKRWKVEEYHKSLKQHVSLCKSPTKVVRSQKNHIFAALYAYFKFECMSMFAKMNRTALKALLYTKALMAAQKELMLLKTAINMKF